MRSRRMLVHVLLAAVALSYIVTPARAANILVSGNAMDPNNLNLTMTIEDLGHTATFVPQANFAGASLAGFDAVWLDGFSRYGADSLSDKLLAFLNSGGNVFVQNPGFGAEPISMYPLGAQLTATLTNPPGEEEVRIVTSGHVMNAELTREGLSALTPVAAFGHFTAIGAFIGLTDTGTDGQWVTIVTNVNNRGFLVYTQQGVAQHLSSAANPGEAATFLNNVVTLSPRPFRELIFDLTLLLDQVTRWDPAPHCTRQSPLFCVAVHGVLLESVDEAMRLLPEGHDGLAIDALWQFVRDTERFMRQGLLPEAEGQSFIAQAEAIIEQIDDQGEDPSR